VVVGGGRVGKTWEMMEEFCSVISVTGVKRPNIGKGDDEKVVCVISKTED
jgi:hypothetical protein